MQFATSCFSTGVWLHYIKRFWPLAAAVFVLLLGGPGILIIGVLGNAASIGAEQTAQTISLILYWTEAFLPIAVAVASFIAAKLVFHHLHNRSETQFIQGLPLTRTALYLTSFLAGLTLLIVPGICSMLVHMALLAAFGYTAAIQIAARIILVGVVSVLLFFSAATFAAVVAGNTLGTILLYAAVNFTVIVLAIGSETPIAVLMPGIELDISSNPLIRWLTPLFNMPYTISSAGMFEATQFSAPSNNMMLFAYTVAAVAIAVLSGCLYSIRKAETAGQTVAFTHARTVCKVLFALVIAAIGTTFVSISGLMDSGFPIAILLVSLLIFAALGWIVAEMLVNKTLRVFNAACFKPCGILLVVLALACLAAWVDPLGRVERIPQEHEVASAQVMSYGHPVQVSAEDATQIHQLALDNRAFIAPSQREISDSLSIAYTLKDGSQVFRTYRYKFEDDQDAAKTQAKQELYNKLDAILSKPDYALQYHFGEAYKQLNERTLVSATGTLFSKDDDGLHDKSVGLSTKKGMELFEAVKKDAEQGKLYTLRSTQGYIESIGEVSFEWTTRPENDDYLQSGFANIQVSKDMTNTLAWLEANNGK